MGWCDNPADLLRISTFVQNDIDPPEGRADAAYLFGHTKYFQAPILNAGATLIKKRMAGELFVCKLAPGYPHNGPEEDPTYRDFEAWRRQLNSCGVPQGLIHPIESPRLASRDEKFPVSHTGTEAERFVALAVERKLKSVYVVTHPIHILRAFTLTVGFVLRNYPELKVYAKAGFPPQPWIQQTISNQGIVTGTRLQVTDGEWDRLNKVYGNKYDPVPASEVLEYVKNPDPLFCEQPNCPFPYFLDHIHCSRCGELFTNDAYAVNKHHYCPALA